MIIFIKKNKLFFEILFLIVLNYFISKYMYVNLQPIELLYTHTSIFYNLYAYMSWPLFFLILFPIFLYKLKWRDIFDEDTIVIKYFIIFIFSIHAWGIITLDYNLYFNQPYHFDRLFLLILLLLSFRFPISFVYFFILSLLFFNQVSYPNFGEIDLGIYVNTKPIDETIILFISFLIIKRIDKNFSILAFFIGVLCFHASNYYAPGLGKILLSEHYIDWIWVNDLSNILIAKYSHGWLAEFISLNSMENIIKLFHVFSIPMQIFTFLVQIIILFLFINKRFTLFLFISFELLHIGILFASGILFWKWILLNIAIIYVLKRLNKENIKKIFNYKMMLFSLPFILLGDGVFHSFKLAWYDTPLNNFNKVYAINTNNQRYEIDANLFHLYKMAWYDGLLNRFNYILDEPIRKAWDTRSQKETEVLNSVSNKKYDSSLENEIYNFEQKYGINKFDVNKKKELIEFLKIYFKNLNAYHNKKIIWNYFSPPRNMYRALSWDKPLYDKYKIKKIEIVFSKNFYNHYSNKLIFLEKKSLVIDIE